MAGILMIGFRAVYIEPILSGQKRATIRKTTRLQAGDEVRARCRYDRPPFATLKVTEVRPIMLWDITEEMAQADGFKDSGELKRELCKTYPDRVAFVLIRFVTVTTRDDLRRGDSIVDSRVVGDGIAS